jgi:hypothetical protein
MPNVLPIDITRSGKSMLSVEYLSLPRNGDGIGKQISPVAGLHFARVLLHSLRPDVTVKERIGEKAELTGVGRKAERPVIPAYILRAPAGRSARNVLCTPRGRGTDRSSSTRTGMRST